jgi:cell wall-associated NlpC family hydrolase
MVGEAVRGMIHSDDPKSMASITSLFLDKPFKWGGTEGSYDCVGLVLDVQKQLGRELPEKAHGYPLRDPAEYEYMYFNDKESLNKEMFEQFSDFGEKINPDYKLPGDILLLSAGEKSLFTAVYCGNSNVLTAIRDRGVLLLSITPNIKVVEVRRLK